MRDRPKCRPDPLSEILELATTRSVFAGGFKAGGSWALQFPPPEKIKFYTCIAGHAWLHFDGEPRARIAAGDVVVLAAPRGFVLTSDEPPATPLDAVAWFGRRADGTIHQIGAGMDYFQIGGHVVLDGAGESIFTQLLPPLVHVRAPTPEAARLSSLLEQLARETAGDRPGATAAMAQLTRLLLLQVLRAQLSGAGSLDAGYLRALADPRLQPALRLMHGEPGRAWQLQELARASAMSRSMFAAHFKAVAGVTPLAYLTAWRMRLAQKALGETATTVSELAHALGYASESAFSTAFKRVIGHAPQHYRLALRAKHIASGSNDRRERDDPSPPRARSATVATAR